MNIWSDAPRILWIQTNVPKCIQPILFSSYLNVANRSFDMIPRDGSNWIKKLTIISWMPLLKQCITNIHMLWNKIWEFQKKYLLFSKLTKHLTAKICLSKKLIDISHSVFQNVRQHVLLSTRYGPSSRSPRIIATWSPTSIYHWFLLHWQCPMENPDPTSKLDVCSLERNSWGWCDGFFQPVFDAC